MAVTVHVTKFPVDNSKRQLLEKLFASPEYSLLREIINSHCVNAQIAGMQALVYKDHNDRAKAELDTHTAQATAYSKTLDVLDEIGKSEQEWFTVTLEPSR